MNEKFELASVNISSSYQSCLRYNSCNIQFTLCKCTVHKILLFFSQDYNHHHEFQDIFIIPKETLYPLVVTSHTLLPSEPGNH